MTDDKQLANLDFSSLEVQEIPFEWNGVKYVLREAMSDAATKYNNAKSQCVELADGDARKIVNMASTRPLLVSLCTFLADSGKAIAVNTVRTWPERMVSVLFKKSLEISELVDPQTKAALIEARDELDEQIVMMDKQEEAAKNDSTDTEDGLT